MKRTAPRFVIRGFVLIGLVSLVALAALVTLVVSASRKGNSGGNVSPTRDHGQNTRAAKPLTRLADGKSVNPLAVNITATLADDITLANKKLPGATITYTAVISNATGTTDAAGVVYNDTLDANTTQTGVVTISPLAINDGTYQSIGNMTLTSANLGANCGAIALRSVTCNDTLNGATLTGFGNAVGTANGTAPGGTVTTTNNGSVVLNADGTFVFNPGAGFEGSDSFLHADKQHCDAELDRCWAGNNQCRRRERHGVVY